MLRHATSCHVMPHHVTSCHIMPRHVTSCHVMPRHVASCQVRPCHVMCHVTSRQAMSRHVMSRHVMSCRKSRDCHTSNASLSTDFFHTQLIQVRHNRVRWLSRRVPIPYRISGISSSLYVFSICEVPISHGTLQANPSHSPVSIFTCENFNHYIYPACLLHM